MSVDFCGNPRFSATSQIPKLQNQAKKAQLNFASNTNSSSQGSSVAQPKFGMEPVTTAACGFLGCCGLLLCGIPVALMAMVFGGGKK